MEILSTDPRLMALSPRDNILVARSEIAEGQTVQIEGVAVKMQGKILVGQKIAARNIRAGEKIFKYGAAIGSATRDIAVGEFVHLHNMKSDYLPTYLREGAQSYVQRH